MLSLRYNQAIGRRCSTKKITPPPEFVKVHPRPVLRRSYPASAAGRRSS